MTQKKKNKFHLWVHSLANLELDVVIAGLYQARSEFEAIDKKLNQPIDPITVAQLIQEAQVKGELKECVALSLPQLKDRYLLLGLGKQAINPNSSDWKSVESLIEQKLVTMHLTKLAILLESFVHPSNKLDKKELDDGILFSIMQTINSVACKQQTELECYFLVSPTGYDHYLDSMVRHLRVINKDSSNCIIQLQH